MPEGDKSNETSLAEGCVRRVYRERLMKPITIVMPYKPGSSLKKTLISMGTSELVESFLIVSPKPIGLKMGKCDILCPGILTAQKTLERLLSRIQTRFLLLLKEAQPILIEKTSIQRLLKEADRTRAGMVYSDFYEESGRGKTLYPLNDYQLGSIRDDFDFGPLILFSVSAIQESVKKYGMLTDVQFAGLYDLRLKVSIDHPIRHIQDPLYSIKRPYRGVQDSLHPGRLFSYLDPRNMKIQKEMEIVFTDYLKKIGAYLSPSQLREVEPTKGSFPVEASVVIPVKNRKETITEAIKSALSQKTDFPFNIIVVDNHSTDGTTDILSRLASQHPQLKHLIPKRFDLGIGGCWNEAITHKACGRFAVQLDSDDLYSNPNALQKMVEHLRQGRYAMVIGSYTLVDFNLREIPPGLIEHREWTDENGHNNALRINGLGAPRGFNTSLIRKIGFRNVSYGEDYEVGLRICREYRIGRIYKSLYLCRRWPGNTDANLSMEEVNQKDFFKDKIRTKEIEARQKLNQGLDA